MNHQSSHRQRTIRFFLIFVFIAILGTVALGQQTSARPDRGAMPGASYQVSDIENISLQNGNVNLSIPLAALPPIAGGKLSWALSAHYNSKIWNMNRTENENDAMTWHPFDVDMAQLSDLGGWQINGQYQITVRNAHEDYDYMTNIPSGSISYVDYQMRVNYNWYKVVLQMPDGSEHELRPIDYSPYPGSEEFLKGYYSDSPYTNATMRYYSFDGSHIYAKINSNAATWTVSMPDGTQIIQGTDAQRIQDTNGNKIKIFSDSNGTHYQDEQTGREIRYVDNSATQGQVWYQTVDGTPEHIDINWGITSVDGQVYQVNDWISGQINPRPCTRYTELGHQEVPVITSIVFPLTEPGQAQRSFSFTYNSDATESATNTVNWSCNALGQSYTRTASKGWGSLNQMTAPSGAVIHYTYSQDTHHVPFPLTADSIPRESVTQKQLTHDGTTDTWAYAIQDTGGTVTNPDGSITAQMQYSHDVGYAWGYGKAGLTFRIQQPFTRIEKHWSDVIFTSACLDSPTGPVNFNPVVDAEYTTLLDGSGNALKMSAKTYQFDYNGNVLGETDYDWFDPTLVTRDSSGVPTGVPGSATVLRTSSNSYYNPATSASSGNVYSKRSLSTGLPLILTALQQTTTGAATAQFSYDGYSYGTAPTVGNLTSKSVWDDVDSKWISTSQTYNSYGNPISATDGRGKVTNFYYDDSTYALPNRVVVDPQNGTGTQTTTTAFDFYTGLVKSQTDANGSQSTIDYTNQLLTTVDPFGRPGIIKSATVTVNGTSQQHRVTTTYVDHSLQVISATDLYAENDQLLKTRATSDMLGRPILSEQTEDGTNYTIFAHKAYDTVNRITYSSGPMRSGAASTDSWTRATSDALGRMIEVATFAGASQPPATGTTSVTGFTGTVTSAYDANFTTVTNQAGKQRRSMVDGGGRLVRVDEPDASNSLGTTSSPAQSTSYDYDVFGNLRHVYQGSSQTRTFSYDSLSRLRSAINPESGEIRYTYDDNGNLATKTDARSIVSTYVYDALNRATSRSYSDSTPTVTYAYDSTTITNGKGRLASVSSSVSSYSYNGYDATGKPLGGSEILSNQSGSQTYSLNYLYDLSGHVTSMTYPSGRAVNYNYDNAGRLADRDTTHLAFTGNLGEVAARTYAKGISYGSGGQMTQEQFGTTTAVFNKLFYNSRSQLAEILASTTGNDTSWNRGKIVNDYSDQCSGASCNGTDNNGNLRKQTIFIPGSDTFAQSYAYDSLNRLQSVNETKNGGAVNWQQQYIYDRYGNRTVDQDTSHTYGSGIPKPNFTASTVNNRLGVPTGLTGTMTYDSAGNLTTDTYSAAAVTRAYDAENRMTKETQASSYDAGIYGYDGDGRRVKRIVGTSETWQVYGLGGELLAEYAATNPSSSSPLKEYGYRNGQLLITATITGGGWGSAPTFTDDPLNPNGTKTDIKLVHLTELRDAVNALRTHAGLSAFSFTVDSNPVQYQTTVKADHIRQLRTGLEQALTALHLPTGGYAHATLTEQASIIYAGDFQELRNQILSAWTSATAGVEIRWLISDQLGTPRIIFDQSGSLASASRHDYLPFGEELFAYTGGRTPAQGYTISDGARQKFTQKERDNETGLDYFLARYYSSTQGRFTSPDEFTGGPQEVYTLGKGDSEKQALPYAEITQPQSLNKYQYAYNNPGRYVDNDGHCPICVIVAVIAILASAEYAEAPTGHPGEVMHPSGTGQRDLVNNIFIGEATGALGRYTLGPLARFAFPSLFAEEAVTQVESRILAHAAEGNAFENRVLGIIGETKNTARIMQGEATGAAYRVPDVLTQKIGGVVGEIKSGQSTLQLTGQFKDLLTYSAKTNSTLKIYLQQDLKLAPKLADALKKAGAEVYDVVDKKIVRRQL